MPMPAEFHDLAKSVNNGGRWDDDDEIGTLNLITEAVAPDCAADGVYTFFHDASPQPFVGGVGSPVNPITIK